MTDALGCSASTQVTVGDTPAQFQGSTTLVSCPGGNNGTAYAEMVPVLGNVSYEWYDASNNLSLHDCCNIRLLSKHLHVNP